MTSPLRCSRSGCVATTLQRARKVRWSAQTVHARLLWLGRAEQQRGRFAEAEVSLARAETASIGPVGAEAQFRIGECRRSAGNLQAAADAFVKLPILYGDAGWVRRGLLEAGLLLRRSRQA